MKLEELIGNNKVKTIINNAISTNNILHSYMFIGTEGIGKAIHSRPFLLKASPNSCRKPTDKDCE